MNLFIVCQIAVIIVYFGSIEAVPGGKSDSSHLVNGCNEIETKLGRITGIQMKTVFGGRPYCGYLGIRFGQPPVGDLRFKAPVPSGPWEGTLVATQYAPACIQTSGNFSSLLQSEDCLFLNVFVPNAEVCGGKTRNISVIVHIFGGAFTEGSSEKNRPDLILNRCVIFLTMNYRVGVFGFLPLGLREYSGNMALKDQQLGMQWAKRHISAFGGDPKRITLFGDSVGGASAGFHVLNAKSRKCFDRVYSLGGSVLNRYVLMDSNDLRPMLRNSSDRLGGADLTTDEQLIEALKTIPTEVWVNFTYINGSSPRLRTRLPTWAPTVENSNAAQPFLTRDPLVMYRSLRSNEIPPSVYTYQTLEMITFIQPAINDPTLIEDLNTNFYLLLPFRGFNQEGCKAETQPLLDKIRAFYFADKVINGSTLVQYARMLTFMNFIYFIRKDIVIRSEISEFAQRLQIDDQKNPLNKYGAKNPKIDALPGPAHGEDLCQLVYCNGFASLYDDVEKYRTSSRDYMNAYKTSKELVDILVSFATTGKPVSRRGNLKSFPRIGRRPLRRLPYIKITNTGDITTGINPTNNEFKLWRFIDQRVQQLINSPCNSQ